MKKFICIILGVLVCGTICFFGSALWYASHTYAAKPVIYLYPEDSTAVSVQLEYNGDLHYTYPTYNDGWDVIA